MPNKLNFSFSDLIAGYITKTEFPELFDCQCIFTLRTSDGREYEIKVTAACYAKLVRSLGEPFQVAPSIKFQTPSPAEELSA